MLAHVRSAGGALTVSALMRLLNGMEHCEAVWLDRALDYKKWVKPSAYQGMAYCSEPLQFAYHNGAMYTRMFSTEEWEPVGDPFRPDCQPDDSGPGLAPLYVPVEIPTGADDATMAAAKEKATAAAGSKHRDVLAAAESVRGFIKTSTDAVLANFGCNDRDTALTDHEWYVNQIPDPTNAVTVGEFDLSWPPPWLVKVRRLRGDDASTEPLAPLVVPAGSAVVNATAALAKAPPVATRVPPAVAGGSARTTKLHAAVLKPSHLKAGAFYLYYHFHEPRLHVLEVLSVPSERASGTLLVEAGDDDTLVTVQRYEISDRPPPGAGLAAKQLRPDMADPEWLDAAWLPSEVCAMTADQIGPQVKLRKDGKLHKLSREVVRAALRVVADEDLTGTGVPIDAP